ncbi:MAG: DUF4198 domain-containing protein [Chitinophagaceae bacterium]
MKKDTAKKTQSERYSRYIKSLVLSGNNTGGELYKKNLGQNFEIVLLQNPYSLHKGYILQAQIFFMGKPMENKIITARNRTGNENTLVLTSRTNSKGSCSFKIILNEESFVHATHMIVCPYKTYSDRESFWAS